MIDINKFIWMYQSKFGDINDHQRLGIIELLTLINKDLDIKDIRWTAYMLATLKHETGNTYLPIAEYGRGKGRKYGIPDGPYGLIYYGRGYTQNTWYLNYLMLTQAWNNLHQKTPLDFTAQPELMLVPEYSYWAMSYSMRHGKYTGVGLPKYINAEKCDYLNARRIINGMDRAELIAGYAEEFEKILTECQS